MASTTMTITTTITTTQAAQVLTLRTIPDWMHKDVHITHGYRPATNSFRQCYHSLWYLHNESVNIWSHLATGIVFVALLVWSVLPDWHGGYRFAESDLRALQAYLLGVTICLFFSVRKPSPTLPVRVPFPRFARTGRIPVLPFAPHMDVMFP